jgi:Ca-activated chloride channel homolog
MNRILLICLLLSLSTFTYAQSKDAKSSLPLTVKLNVSVTDANGQSITDLSQDQFRIFENDVPQTITVFERKDRPLVFGLAIDATGSMRRQLNRVVETGKLFAGELRPDESMFVVKFISSQKIELMQELTSNRVAIENQLDQIYVEGGLSSVVDAIYFANQYVVKETKGGANARRALILVSDGEDRKSKHTQDELLAELKESGLQVFAIALSGQLESDPAKAENFLRRVTQETGGTLYRLNDSTPVGPVVTQIMWELRAPYLMGFDSTNPVRDGKSRKVRVEVPSANGKYAIGFRADYSPPKK